MYTHRRLFCFLAVCANCITAGSIFTFPLFGPPLARGLGLTGAQTNALASASILGEYAAAVFWGSLADRRGPGAVSFCAAVLYALGYGMMGWRYKVSVGMAERGEMLPEGQWIWLCGYYFLAGCGTAASYFGAIIAATKSTPKRHSGLAIGVPCAIFGLSPLFLSALAPYFTVSSVSSSFSSLTSGDQITGINDELDPGQWLLFLALALFIVNGLSGFALGEIPCEEHAGEEGFKGEREREREGGRDSGFVGSEENSLIDVERGGEGATERTALLGARREAIADKEEQSIAQLLRTPTFWLLGLVIFLSTGPCEMVMASLGGIVESLLGIRITTPPSPSSTSFALLLSTLTHDSRALSLRRLHVQVLSISNTISRLLIGLLSDWLSYAAEPIPEAELGEGWWGWWKRTFHRKPQVSRLAFLVAAGGILAVAYAYVAMGLESTNGLWVLSVATGLSYGLVFTLAPAIVRVVYPVSAFGRNWGLLTWFSALGALLFTPLFGILLDLAAKKQHSEVCYGRGCYEVVFVLSSLSCAMAAGIVGVLWKGWWRGLV